MMMKAYVIFVMLFASSVTAFFIGMFVNDIVLVGIGIVATVILYFVRSLFLPDQPVK